MPVKMVLNRNAPPGTVPVKIFTEDVEMAALQQLKILHNCQSCMDMLRQCRMCTWG